VRSLLLWLLLSPLGTAAVNAVLGGRLSRRAVEMVACAGSLGALTMAVAAFALGGGQTHDVTLASWFSAGGVVAVMDVHFDALAALMVLTVTFVAALVHLYSVAFMGEDPGYVRFFCYLNLFLFAMLVIALADSLLFVYLGWEGVGFCSYALIGFWYRDPQNGAAGRKAFLLTRIGDVAFGVALALLFTNLGSFSVAYVAANASVLGTGTATVLGFLLLWAAVGKSAQLPLAVWLPDAMAGPTPVSALIHAATMVTAGVYLLMRLFPVLALSPSVLLAVATVGGVTALYAALAAQVQTDIKRVLAYSTMSQVAYMFLAVGAGDLVSAMFLLVSHAFFKALLFLVAGCLLWAFRDEHDIYALGNLRRLLPRVYWLFLAGALSLAAFPLVGGFFSKDRILLATFLRPGAPYKILWAAAFLGALLTALYTMRLFFVAARVRPDGGPGEARPVPRLMTWTLWPLAALALVDGLLNLPFGPGKRWLASFLSRVPGAVVDLGASPALDWAMAVGDALGVAAVVALAWVLYRRPRQEPERRGMRETLFTGFYLDRLYALAVAGPLQWCSRALAWTDEAVLGLGFEAAGAAVQRAAGLLRHWTTGRLSTYLRMTFFGCAAILALFAVLWWGRG
jgi:NADH-quinone oxidoreductase subunit L